MRRHDTCSDCHHLKWSLSRQHKNITKHAHALILAQPYRNDCYVIDRSDSQLPVLTSHRTDGGLHQSHQKSGVGTRSGTDLADQDRHLHGIDGHLGQPGVLCGRFLLWLLVPGLEQRGCSGEGDPQVHLDSHLHRGYDPVLHHDVQCEPSSQED